MDRNIINLYLTEVGRKALKCDVKVISTDKAKKDITKDYIEEIFPLALVERYEIVENFLNLTPGDYVLIVRSDGSSTLGRYVANYYRNELTVSEYENSHFQYRFNEFGIEIAPGRSKYKSHLERISPEEANVAIRKLENKPFVESLKLLNKLNNQHENIEFDEDNLVLPEWLCLSDVTEILDILKNARERYELKLKGIINSI